MQVYHIDPLTVAAQAGTSLAMIERACLRFIPSALRRSWRCSGPEAPSYGYWGLSNPSSGDRDGRLPTLKVLSIVLRSKRPEISRVKDLSLDLAFHAFGR